MELLKNLLLIIIAVAFILVLIGISWKVLNFAPKQEFSLKGDKQKIIKKIVELIYECYEKNEYRKESVLCFQVSLDSDEIIYSNEITGKIDFSRISDVILPDTLQNNTIIIRYENKIVYLEITEGKRLGS
jgi:hypothetical protein